LCDDASQGKRLLTAAIDALFRQPLRGSFETSGLENPEDISVSEAGNMKEQESALLWTALYMQEIVEVWLLPLLFCFGSS